MLNESDVSVAISIFLRHPLKKTLLIYGFSISDFFLPLVQKIKQQEIPFFCFDISQQPDIENILESIPFNQPVIFIFTNTGLLNPYLNYHLERWQAKVIILADSSLMHPTLDPSIYFTPFKDSKAQKQLLSKIKVSTGKQRQIKNKTKSSNSAPTSATDQLDHNYKLRNHFLNKKLMTNDHAMMRMFADRVITDESYKEYLFEFIFDSKKDIDIQIGAANAFTTLNYARVSFSGLNLARIKAPSSDLSDAVLDQTNLWGADLSNGIMTGAWLRQANLSNAILLNTKISGQLVLSHDANVSLYTVEYSPTGEIIATADAKGIIYLWESTSSHCIALLGGHKQGNYPINHINFSSDGQFLASSGQDGQVCVWHVSTQLLIAKLIHSEVVEVLTFVDQSRLISATVDQVIWIWNYKTNQLLGCYEGAAKKLSISSDGMLLAIDENTIRLWYLTKQGNLSSSNKIIKNQSNFIREIIGYANEGIWHTMKVKPFLTLAANALDGGFMPDEKTIVTLEKGGTIKHWDRQTGNQINEVSLSNNPSFINLWIAALSRDKKLVAFAKDYIVYLWSIEAGHICNTFQTSQKGMIISAVSRIAYHPNGKEIALLVSGSHTVTLRQIDEDPKQLSESHNIIAVTHSPLTESIIAVSSENIVLYSIENSKKMYEWYNYKDGQKWSATAISISISSNNQLLVISQRTKVFFIYDLVNKTIIQLEDEWVISAVSFLPDNMHVVCAHYLSHSFSIWSLSEKKVIARHIDQMLEIGHNDGTGSNCVTVSTAGNIIAIGARDREVECWASQSWKTKFGKDKIISKKDNYVYFDAKSFSFPHESAVTCIAISPCEKYLAVGCQDGSLAVWDMVNRIPILFLPRIFQRAVSAVAFLSVESMQVAYVSLDCTLKIFSPIEKKPYIDMTFPAPITNIILVGKNKFLLHDGDGTLMRWQFKYPVNDTRDLMLIWRLGQGSFCAEESIVYNVTENGIKKYLPPSIQDESTIVSAVKGTFFNSRAPVSAAPQLSRGKLISYDKLEMLAKKYELSTISQLTLGKALRQAAANNMVNDLNFLISIVKDINIQDTVKNIQKTALHWAVTKKHAECVKILLAAGASIYVLDANNETPLDYADKSGNDVIKSLLLSKSNTSLQH